MAAIPGDLVRLDGAEKVVVDVTDESVPVMVVLRDPGNPDSKLTAAPIDALEVVGHVESVPGWVEDERGVWRQT